MQNILHSSGDIVADRRAGLAAALAAERAFAEAAEVMEQALELAPNWVAGWSLLGGYREAAGDIAGAVKAWFELMKLDLRGIFGARLKLVAHGVLDDPKPEPGYVEALFDDYAQRFERSLLEGLKYRVPDRIAEMLGAEMAVRGIVRFERAIDLGCGTGLVGERIRPLVERLDGVDLSANMLRQAARKQVYDRLEKADLVSFLGAGERGGLIVAADVFNYLGALEAPLMAVRKALKPGGLAIFTLELDEEGAPVRLATSLRFQHALEPTLTLCERLGFTICASERETLRYDRGQPVAGAVVMVAG